MHLYIFCTLLFTQCIEINWERRLRFGLGMDITFMFCMKSWYNLGTSDGDKEVVSRRRISSRNLGTRLRKV